MYECAANSPIPNGFSSSCRGLCREGYRNTMYESDPTCSTHMGASDMILQTTTKAHAPFNIWNYDPEHNYNQGDFDATDEFFGWVLGFANYYNPTANYSGKGTAYNGASIYPFQPSNPSQDHPRHRCRRFKDLYSMYQYYVGPDYAKYLVEVNVGFHADLSNQVDPCTYIGSSTEVGYFAYGYFQVDEGYPVGSMTELCTRQRYLAEHNSMGVAVTTVNGESVVTIDYNDPRNPLYDPQRHKVYNHAFLFLYRLEIYISLFLTVPCGTLTIGQGQVRGHHHKASGVYRQRVHCCRAHCIAPDDWWGGGGHFEATRVQSHKSYWGEYTTLSVVRFLISYNVSSA